MYEEIFLFFWSFKNNFGDKLKPLCPLFLQACISVGRQCWHVCRLTRQWRRPPCLRRACHRWRTWGTRHAPPPALSRPPHRCPASHGSSRFIYSFHLFFKTKRSHKTRLWIGVQRMSLVKIIFQ